jgi:hypothetical protein
MRMHTEEEVADWVVCRDSGVSTEVFHVESHSEWLRARMEPDVWITPGRLQRHIDFWAAVPFWALTLMTGAIPALWIGRSTLRRFGRKSAGANACRQCGYDLTGNISGTCPECGSRVEFS